LGTYLICSKLLHSSYSEAKACFYRSFTSIILFWEKGRIAPENVTVHLIKTKCLPVLFYGAEACPINKSQMQSFEYVIYSSFMKVLQLDPRMLLSVPLL